MRLGRPSEKGRRRSRRTSKKDRRNSHLKITEEDIQRAVENAVAVCLSSEAAIELLLSAREAGVKIDMRRIKKQMERSAEIREACVNSMKDGRDPSTDAMVQKICLKILADIVLKGKKPREAKKEIKDQKRKGDGGKEFVKQITGDMKQMTGDRRGAKDLLRPPRMKKQLHKGWNSRDIERILHIPFPTGPIGSQPDENIAKNLHQAEAAKSRMTLDKITQMNAKFAEQRAAIKEAKSTMNNEITKAQNANEAAQRAAAADSSLVDGSLGGRGLDSTIISMTQAGLVENAVAGEYVSEMVPIMASNAEGSLAEAMVTGQGEVTLTAIMGTVGAEVATAIGMGEGVAGAAADIAGAIGGAIGAMVDAGVGLMTAVMGVAMGDGGMVTSGLASYASSAMGALGAAVGAEGAGATSGVMGPGADVASGASAANAGQAGTGAGGMGDGSGCGYGGAAVAGSAAVGATGGAGNAASTGSSGGSAGAGAGFGAGGGGAGAAAGGGSGGGSGSGGGGGGSSGGGGGGGAA